MATEHYRERGNGRSPEEIEEDIAHTREEMQRTVTAIEHKLSPGQLLDQAIHQIGSIPTEFGANMVDSVKSNPLPVALVAVGVAWLMRSDRSAHAAPHLHSESGKVGETLRSAGRKMKEAASAVKPGEYAASASDRLSGMAEGVSHRARYTSYRMRRTLETALREQPLVLGALGMAIGAILGTSIPATETENEWMGSARDDLLEKAKEKGTEAVQRSEQILSAGREGTVATKD